jgi:ferrochelatase
MSETEAKHMRKGLLVVNLGTPEKPERKPVARFLREFLSDPRVVDLPRFLWLPLLNLVIIPFRSGRSAAAYREIWWPEGSPLLVLTQRLVDRLRAELAETTRVEIGMRYGKPSIRQGLAGLKEAGVSEVTILPLYPQFSHTTTTSIYDAVEEALLELHWQPQRIDVRQYHDHPAWIEAVARSIRRFREAHGAPEKLVFSLHGIPQRYVAQGDPYQMQCEQSAAAVAAAAGLTDDEWLLTYQSRVGREPWLQPYTDKTLEEMAAGGVRRIHVVCPGFAVDCLETLEEIAMQNRESFIEAGGESLDYIPALNDSDEHVAALKAILQDPA